MQKKSTTKIKKGLELALFLFLLVVLWQILNMLFVDVFKIWKPYSAPSPAGVAFSFASLLKSGVLLSALLKSLGRGGGGLCHFGDCRTDIGDTYPSFFLSEQEFKACDYGDADSAQHLLGALCHFVVRVK